MPKIQVRQHARVPEISPGRRCAGKSCREHQNEQAELERLQREVAELPIMQIMSQGRLPHPQEEFDRQRNGGVDLDRLAGDRIKHERAMEAAAESRGAAPE